MTFPHPSSKSDPALVLPGSSTPSVSFPRLCLNAVVLSVVFPIHWLPSSPRTAQLGCDPRHQEMQQSNTRGDGQDSARREQITLSLLRWRTPEQDQEELHCI